MEPRRKRGGGLVRAKKDNLEGTRAGEAGRAHTPRPVPANFPPRPRPSRSPALARWRVRIHSAARDSAAPPRGPAGDPPPAPRRPPPGTRLGGCARARGLAAESLQRSRAYHRRRGLPSLWSRGPESGPSLSCSPVPQVELLPDRDPDSDGTKISVSITAGDRGRARVPAPVLAPGELGHLRCLEAF